MDNNKRIQENIKKKWIKELQIKCFSPIYIIQITEKDKTDRIKWNKDQKCWEMFLNKNSRERVVAHEYHISLYCSNCLIDQYDDLRFLLNVQSRPLIEILTQVRLYCGYPSFDHKHRSFHD